jgi:uncharacterized protein (TIGR00369 family)
MKVIDEGFCFVCGKANERGLKLSFSSDKGKSSAEFILQQQFQGYRNIIHGGIIAAILDEAMIHSAVSENLNPVTAEITIRYKQPLYADMPAVVDAELTQRGPRLLKARAWITDRTSGVLIAEATGKMIPLKKYP